MIEYRAISLGEMETNCYFVWDETTKASVIIDPADDGVFLSQELETMQLVPNYIVASHGHFDHLLGALDLKLIYQVPFCLNSNDAFLLKKTSSSASYWLKHKIAQPELVADGDLDEIGTLVFGESTLLVIKTPGHTPGSVCFYAPDEGLLFSGDTISDERIGRADLRYSSSADLLTSIKKLRKLPSETIVLPGHGRQFALSMI